MYIPDKTVYNVRDLETTLDYSRAENHYDREYQKGYSWPTEKGRTKK